MKTEMYPEGTSPELNTLQQEIESMKVKIEKVIVVSTFEEFAQPPIYAAFAP